MPCRAFQEMVGGAGNVTPLSPSLFQSAQGLRYCAYVAPQFSARVFSAWEHDIRILTARSTPSMRRPIPVKNWFCFFL